MISRHGYLFGFAACALCAEISHASCGMAFCMVNTNWNLQGLVAEPGLRLDLRYEFIDQDQPLAGSDKVAVGRVRRHHDEVRTINRNLLATLDYTINDAWGVSAILPVVHPDHTHIHNHQGEQITEAWSFTRAGDARVLGRYQWPASDVSSGKLDFAGVNFGLKLPTGERDVANAAGAVAERTLQPGTGTTDALLGGYFNRVLPDTGASWFVQGMLQAPLDSRSDYRPGRRVSIDWGFRYELSDSVGVMLQANALYRWRDKGGQAEPEDSGGRFFYLSPGASFALSKQTQVYAFFQLPVYQHVNGVQLVADWSAVIGLTTRF